MAESPFLSFVEERHSTDTSIYLGHNGGTPLFAHNGDPAVIFAGDQSDARNKIIIPSVIFHPGPVVVLSANNHIHNATQKYREGIAQHHGGSVQRADAANMNAPGSNPSHTFSSVTLPENFGTLYITYNPFSMASQGVDVGSTLLELVKQWISTTKDTFAYGPSSETKLLLAIDDASLAKSFGYLPELVRSGYKDGIYALVALDNQQTCEHMWDDPSAFLSGARNQIFLGEFGTSQFLKDKAALFGTFDASTTFIEPIESFPHDMEYRSAKLLVEERKKIELAEATQYDDAGHRLRTFNETMQEIWQERNNQGTRCRNDFDDDREGGWNFLYREIMELTQIHLVTEVKPVITEQELYRPGTDRAITIQDGQLYRTDIVPFQRNQFWISPTRDQSR